MLMVHPKRRWTDGALVAMTARCLDDEQRIAFQLRASCWLHTKLSTLLRHTAYQT